MPEKNDSRVFNIVETEDRTRTFLSWNHSVPSKHLSMQPSQAPNKFITKLGQVPKGLSMEPEHLLDGTMACYQDISQKRSQHQMKSNEIAASCSGRTSLQPWLLPTNCHIHLSDDLAQHYPSYFSPTSTNLVVIDKNRQYLVFNFLYRFTTENEGT